jgi:pyruvate,orthophosphate dikinase
MTLADMKVVLPEVFKSLMEIERVLEQHYRDVQDIEFIVQNGILYILQTRNAKRTAQAAVKIAVSMMQEKMITEREAIMRIDANQMDYFLHLMDYFLHLMVDNRYLKEHEEEVMKSCYLATGLAALAGAACGKVEFTNEEAARCAGKGEDVILCREADDIGGLQASEGHRAVQ